MIVVRFEMWPDEDHTKAINIGLASFKLRVNHAGERSFDVTFFKLPDHGGPDAGVGVVRPEVATAIKARNPRDVWQKMAVRGHFPARLGIFDLVCGAGKVILGDRLGSYRQVQAPKKRREPGEEG